MREHGTVQILTSDNIKLFDGLASIPALNIFESYLFFGALVVLFLLLKSPEGASPSRMTLHSVGKP